MLKNTTYSLNHEVTYKVQFKGFKSKPNDKNTKVIKVNYAGYTHKQMEELNKLGRNIGTMRHPEIIVAVLASQDIS